MEQQEQNIKTLLHTAFFLVSIFIIGCSSSEETQDDQLLTEFEEDTSVVVDEPVKQTPSKQQKTSPIVSQRFTVQADTVDVQKKNRLNNSTTSISVKSAPPKRFYTVEVGAFRQQSNVKRHQEQLSKRFKLPVRVLFDSTLNLTRVCVGTFSTKTLAENFLKKIKTEYPKDYPDLWVSYWTK